MSASTFELPGMVEHSAEAYAAGAATGMRRWRATFDLGVVCEIAACSFADAVERAGDRVLLLEDLDAAEVV